VNQLAERLRTGTFNDWDVKRAAEEVDKVARLTEVAATTELVLKAANETIEQLTVENAALQPDAEKWRAYQARKTAALNAGFGKSPLRSDAEETDQLIDEQGVDKDE